MRAAATATGRDGVLAALALALLILAASSALEVDPAVLDPVRVLR